MASNDDAGLYAGFGCGSWLLALGAYIVGQVFVSYDLQVGAVISFVIFGLAVLAGIIGIVLVIATLEQE